MAASGSETFTVGHGAKAELCVTAKQGANHGATNCDSATTADGLSAALFVLGEQRALQLAEQQGLAVFLIIRDGSGYRTEMSSAFKQLLRDKDKS